MMSNDSESKLIYISYIYEQLETFSKLAHAMSNLKVPFRFTLKCECQIIDSKNLHFYKSRKSAYGNCEVVFPFNLDSP